MPSFAEFMDPFEAAAARTRQSVKPEGGRQEGLATKLLENYAPHVGKGLADLMMTPQRAYQQGLSPEEEIAFGANTAMGMAGKTPFAEPGAAGVFGGRLSKTADQANLSLAELMHEKGIDRRQIWDATGWFQDAGGLWRYRIPDTNLKVHVDTPLPGKGLSPGPNTHIEHPEMAEAYPELANMTHIILPHPPDISASGSFFRGDESHVPHIRINANRNDIEGARSVAAHELSHAADYMEGASTGASPSTLRRYADYVIANEHPEYYRAPNSDWNSLAVNAAREAYRRFAGETRARAAQKELNMSPEELKNTPGWESEDRPRSLQIVAPQDWDKLKK